MSEAERATWQSKTGFLLAALGSAIGLGNIWRFPYMAYRNGGGAFLVPYFVALFVVGIPLLMLEFGLGHYFRSALPKSLEKIHPRFSWIGWWSVSFVMFGIVAYYGVVISWCANYLVYAVTQPWGDAARVNAFFDEQVLQLVHDGEVVSVYEPGVGFPIGTPNLSVLGGLALVWFVNWLIVRRNLQHGIELANKVFIPLLIILTLALVVWSWGFPGADAGRELYLKPDWTLVFQAQTWIDAFSQIFFTLSIAFGIMVAYSSYLPRETDIPTSAFLAAMGNCAFSVIAAFSVFAAIGFLGQQRDIDVSRMHEVSRDVEALNRRDPSTLGSEERERLQRLRREQERNAEFEQQMSTFGLVFKTYPAIITAMGPVAGRIFGVLFFLSLVIAGISSSISIVEAFLASLADEFGWRRGPVAGTLCCAAFVLGIVFCAPQGLLWLDLVDHFITTYGLVLVAIAESLIVGWIFRAERLRSHLDEHRDFRFGPTFSLAMRLLITAVLMLTWLGLGELQGTPIAQLIGRVALLGSIVVLWVCEHWLDFDIRVIVPCLLIILIDQALQQELASPYGGYPVPAIVGIGVVWFAATLLIGVILGCLAQHRARPRG